MSDSTLRIHHIQWDSRVNGPGLRAVVWVQGCSLGCKGCFNPQTHPLHAGDLCTIDELSRDLISKSAAIDGLTFSGGEPLLQADAVAQLCTQIKHQTNLSIILLTGFSWQEIQSMPHTPEILANIDVLLAGRFNHELKTARSLMGSSNKTAHFLTPRYTPADFAALPASEAWISPQGEIILSGIDPLQW